MRGNKPVLFADLKSGQGREDLLGWLRREYLFVKSNSYFVDKSRLRNDLCG
jgi:hypothetical protein